MNPSFIASVISTLRLRAKRYREESERYLIKSACSGVAIILSSSIGLLSYYVGGGLLIGTVALLAAGVLLPISNLIANSIFNSVKKSWVTSGDVFQRLRYLDYEYFEDIRRLTELPLPDSEKQKFMAERHQRYIDDTDPFRERIRNLSDITDTNLITNWRYPLPK
jgi:hypothetical protein